MDVSIQGIFGSNLKKRPKCITRVRLVSRVTLTREKTQLSMVDGCALKRIADLPLSFNLGACTSTSDQVFLCFEKGSDRKTCRVGQSGTGPFVEVKKSIYEHYAIRIAASSSKSINENKLNCYINTLHLS